MTLKPDRSGKISRSSPDRGRIEEMLTEQKLSSKRCLARSAVSLQQLLRWVFDLLGPLLQVSEDVEEHRHVLLQKDCVSTKKELEVW